MHGLRHVDGLSRTHLRPILSVLRNVGSARVPQPCQFDPKRIRGNAERCARGLHTGAGTAAGSIPKSSVIRVIPDEGIDRPWVKSLTNHYARKKGRVIPLQFIVENDA